MSNLPSEPEFEQAYKGKERPVVAVPKRVEPQMEMACETSTLTTTMSS